MAYSTKTIPIDNLLINDTYSRIIDKINKNESTIATQVESVYNNLYFNPISKVIGDQSSISNVNTQTVTIDIPQTSKQLKGINFILNGVSKGSILTDANGDTFATFKGLTATSLSAADTISATTSISTTSFSATGTASVGTLALTLGGVKSINPVEVSITPVDNNGTSVLTLSNISLDTPSNKLFSASIGSGVSTVNITIPTQNDTTLDGYEFTVLIRNSGNNSVNSGTINLVYGGTIINTNNTTYQIGTSFTSGHTKVITFRFVGAKIVVKSVA